MSMPAGIRDTGVIAAEFEQRLAEMVDRRYATAVPDEPTRAGRSRTDRTLSPGMDRQRRSGPLITRFGEPYLWHTTA